MSDQPTKAGKTYEHTCPLCSAEEDCPGSHCLVELRDVVGAIRAFGKAGTQPRDYAEQIADEVMTRFAPVDYR